MSDRPNALQMPPAPGYEDNPLMGGATPADAWDANRQAYADWLARDRQRQIALGYVDPATGQLTPEGWRQQAQTIAGGFGPADIGAVGIGAIKAYHGSPHLFEPTPKNPLGEFRLDKIGTGEGNQAFGQGMYVAEREAIAREGYRDKLSEMHLQYGDQPLDAHAADSGNPYAQDAATNLRIAVKLGQSPADAVAAQIADARRIAQAATDRFMTRTAEHHAGVADYLDTLDPAQIQQTKGHMYEVNLNAEPEDFLHWDKPLSEQSPQVQQIIEQERPRLFEKGPSGIPAEDMAGEDFLRLITREAQNPAEAAAKLRAMGIPGIRYLDASSRGKGEGTHNYAVFDPDKMDIIRRFGIAGLIGGGAAATAAGGQDQGNQ